MLKFLLILMTSMFCSPVFAASFSQDRAAAFDLNKASPNAMAKHVLGSRVVDNVVRVLTASYDFSKQGGAIGTGNLLVGNQPARLPKGAIVLDCIIDVLTPATTSASGTIALTAQSAGDIKAALAAASYTGRVACIPVGTAATAIKITADRILQYTIATGAITAGKFDVKIQYVTGQ